jgi:two-component system, OmpR family, sensor histidine kinase KdpD
VSYRGANFEDLDVARLLTRCPTLALIDELAHANLPGERHAKRWQDVDELLAAGIDVHTTLNVANIESLGELVATITGVNPAEPVPDSFLRGGEIRLVELEPSALRRRLAQGLVFADEHVDAALSNYFRYANLAALHELAQLWLDGTVSDPVGTFRAAHDVRQPVTSTVIVVGLEGSPSDEWLIRYAACCAGLSDVSLQGVHVRAFDNLDRPAREQLDDDRRLLSELNGALLEIRADDPATGLIQAAHDAGAAQLVVGSRKRSRRSLRSKRSTAGQLLRTAGDLPVQVVNVGRPTASGQQRRPSRTGKHPHRVRAVRDPGPATRIQPGQEQA